MIPFKTFTLSQLTHFASGILLLGIPQLAEGACSGGSGRGQAGS